MIYFDKTLNELASIITDINHQIDQKLNDPDFVGLVVRFNEWFCEITFQNQSLVDSENDQRLYEEEADEMEDIKDCIKRKIQEKTNRLLLIEL